MRTITRRWCILPVLLLTASVGLGGDAPPKQTVGRVHSRLPVKGPYDQRETETRPDVLVFTTPTLTAPLQMVGQIRAKLWASAAYGNLQQQLRPVRYRSQRG